MFTKHSVIEATSMSLVQTTLVPFILSDRMSLNWAVEERKFRQCLKHLRNGHHLSCESGCCFRLSVLNL